MCHETTSIALPASIGVPVGTVTLDDFAKTECILFFGQNPGSNSPRMLHPLQQASERGVPIIVYNPLKERGLERFTNPQSPVEMLTGQETQIASQYHQVKAGGDLAALSGVCKALLALEDRDGGVLDHAFIAEHTHGFDEFIAWLLTQEWDKLEQHAGLPRAAMEATAATYSRAKSAMAIYGMGLTQHRAGVETIQMLINLLLMRGNMGREGAGICPVRGHSNVQGQRTVGITEKPELVPMDKLKRAVQLRAAHQDRAQHGGSLRGNPGRQGEGLLHAGRQLRARHPGHRPDGAGLGAHAALTVNVATKLNRSHLVHGQVSYIPAGAGPHRGGPAADRAAGAVHGRQPGLHPRLQGRALPGVPLPDERDPAGGGDRQGDAGPEPEGDLGRLGRRLQPDPQGDHRHLPGHLQGLRGADVGARRLPSPPAARATACGKPRPARPTTSFRVPWTRTRTCRRTGRTCCA